MKHSIFFIILITVALLMNPVKGTGQSSSYNQGKNIINTGMHMLRMPPDARFASLGGAGVSSSPDFNSMHANPAKYAFGEKEIGVSRSILYFRLPSMRYTLQSNAFCYKPDTKSALAAFASYMFLTDSYITKDTYKRQYRPLEYAIALAYSRKLNDYIAGAAVARLNNSNVFSIKTSRTIAIDLALFYHRDVTLLNKESSLNWGLNISNIGPKISIYEDGFSYKSPLPTNLCVGAGLTFKLSEIIHIGTYVDLNKLLVPTPPLYKYNEYGMPIIRDDGRYEIEKGMDPNVSVLRGMMQSFYDAPGGLEEELHEVMINFGAELTFLFRDFNLAFRGGYQHEHKTKGNSSYIATGFGIHYKILGVDFAIRKATASQFIIKEQFWLSVSVGLASR